MSSEVTSHGKISFCAKLALSSIEVTASRGADTLVSRAIEAPSCTRMANAADSLYVSYIVCVCCITCQPHPALQGRSLCLSVGRRTLGIMLDPVNIRWRRTKLKIQEKSRTQYMAASARCARAHLKSVWTGLLPTIFCLEGVFLP